MLPVRPADMLSAVFAFSFLVPKLQLGNADVSEALLPKWDRIGRRQRSWSFEDKFIPKLELGNEGRRGSGRGRLRAVVAIEILNPRPGIKDDDAIFGRDFPRLQKFS